MRPIVRKRETGVEDVETYRIDLGAGVRVDIHYREPSRPPTRHVALVVHVDLTDATEWTGVRIDTAEAPDEPTMVAVDPRFDEDRRRSAS